MPSHTPKHTGILPLRSGNLKKKNGVHRPSEICRWKVASGDRFFSGRGGNRIRTTVWSRLGRVLTTCAMFGLCSLLCYSHEREGLQSYGPRGLKSPLRGSLVALGDKHTLVSGFWASGWKIAIPNVGLVSLSLLSCHCSLPAGLHGLRVARATSKSWTARLQTLLAILSCPSPPLKKRERKWGVFGGGGG